MKLHLTAPWDCINGETRERITLAPGTYDLERKVIQPPPPGSPPRKVWLVVVGTSNGMAETSFRNYVSYATPHAWLEEQEDECFQFLRVNIDTSHPPRIYIEKHPDFLGEHCIELFPQELPILDHFESAESAHRWLAACFGEDQHRSWFPDFVEGA